MKNKANFLISFSSYVLIIMIALTIEVTRAEAGIISSIIKNFSDDIAKHAVKNYGDDVAKAVVKNYGDDVAKGLAKNYGDDVAKGLAKNYGDDVAKGLAKNYGDDVAKGLAKNYGDDVARQVASNYGDDVMRYAVREGSEEVSKRAVGEGTAKIIGAIGKAAPSLAIATVILTGTSAVSTAIAKPLGQVLNVSSEAVATKITPLINFIFIFLPLYIIVRGIMQIWHIHKKHTLKEKKLEQNIDVTHDKL